MDEPTEFLRFAGRRQSRPVRGSRKTALQDVTKRFYIPDDILSQDVIDPNDLFSQNPKEKLWLEIGFGNGEHLVGQAENNPNIGLIGCEPFINGVSAAAKDVVEKNLENIRFWADDAFTVLPKFQSESLDRIFLLFSDPWPKTRQHKRRVIQNESVALFARLLKPGGILRLATDHKHLAEWMLVHVAMNPHFQWQNMSRAEWREAPKDWIETRYQQKAALEGRQPYFMDFIKL